MLYFCCCSQRLSENLRRCRLSTFWILVTLTSILHLCFSFYLFHIVGSSVTLEIKDILCAITWLEPDRSHSTILIWLKRRQIQRGKQPPPICQGTEWTCCKMSPVPSHFKIHALRHRLIWAMETEIIRPAFTEAAVSIKWVKFCSPWSSFRLLETANVNNGVWLHKLRSNQTIKD